MKVILHLGEPFWRVAGQREVEVVCGESATLADALEALIQMYPGLARDLRGGEARPALFLDDAEAGPDTPLRDGARVYVVWPVSGGD